MQTSQGKLSMNLQERNDLYRRTMSVGVGPLGRVRLHISLAMQQAIFWLLSGCLAVVETVSFRIIWWLSMALAHMVPLTGSLANMWSTVDRIAMGSKQSVLQDHCENPMILCPYWHLRWWKYIYSRVTSSMVVHASKELKPFDCGAEILYARHLVDFSSQLWAA